MRKEGDGVSSEEVGKKMKQIMNMLGQAIVNNFKSKKSDQRGEQMNSNQLRVPDQNNNNGFTQAVQTDRPLLVKDIRAKMGHEIVKLMQKYKMKKVINLIV